jgi:hypothetical protein
VGQGQNDTNWRSVVMRVTPLLILLGILVVAYFWLRGLRGLSPAAAMYTRAARGASWSGVHREPAMTANEYAQAISESVPGSRQPVNYLADLYVRETYSPRKASQSDLLRARQAWLRLRGLLLKNVFLRLRPWHRHEEQPDVEEW